MKRKLIIFILLVAASLAMGCTSYDNTEQPADLANETTISPANETPAMTSESMTVEVSIQNFAFNPQSVTISPGDMVKWTNFDSVPHTVEGADFASDALQNGDSFSHTFTENGTYDYKCSIHPSMTGEVIVQ
ncbi:cupredoxin family copper-binding protein [Methanolobus sediminis]|uniref:Cupredoxin family copper-binding protein n=1 Tax=Methanolobus sediminis TaxID=3072978 RepID=A0AA51UJ02_9EURY|nr:cupredoxin family copper-binding protein [Methanolobus sediminis]WMW24259.1 cupredoxin family copper-binding protein [Methanolobus sediminis]